MTSVAFRGRKEKQESNEEGRDCEESKNLEKAFCPKYYNGAKSAVSFDNIYKETIRLERKAQRRWQEKYACLSGEYYRKVQAEECRKAGLPADTFERKSPEDLTKCSPILLKNSPAIPKTTSAMIGWRSRIEYNLEFVDSTYFSPRFTLKSMQLEPKEQKFIFLG